MQLDDEGEDLVDENEEDFPEGEKTSTMKIDFSRYWSFNDHWY